MVEFELGTFFLHQLMSKTDQLYHPLSKKFEIISMEGTQSGQVGNKSLAT